MLRVIRWVAIGLVIVLAGVWAGIWWRGQDSPNPIAGLSAPGAISVGGPFSLVDSTGKTVTDSQFRGRWMLIYFGYTFCPDVCPTELQVVAASLDKLGSQAAKLAPIFITVDPERDTPAAMGEYVKLFDDRLIGLTGSQAQITAALRAYRVYAVKSESKASSSYLMDHSSFLYLMGPDGTLQALFKPGTSADDIANTSSNDPESSLQTTPDEDAGSPREPQGAGGTAPRYSRRLSDKILIAFHHACDQADFEIAEQLLRVLENLLNRRPVNPDANRRRSMETLVAAYERLWHLRAEPLYLDLLKGRSPIGVKLSFELGNKYAAAAFAL
eukprot:gene10940-11023_t